MCALRVAIFATTPTRSAICARVKPSGKMTRNGFGGGGSGGRRRSLRVMDMRERDGDGCDGECDTDHDQSERDHAPPAQLLGRRSRPARD